MNEKTGRDAMLSRLKTFARIGSTTFYGFDELRSAINGETDRGAVIILASILENRLELALLARMQPLSKDERARLFGYDSPLSSLSSKIRMSRALSIVTRSEARILDVIREMRNICAHYSRDISFKTEELRDTFFSILDDVSAAELTQAEPAQLKAAFIEVMLKIMDVVYGAKGQPRSTFGEAAAKGVSEALAAASPDK